MNVFIHSLQKPGKGFCLTLREITVNLPHHAVHPALHFLVEQAGPAALVGKRENYKKGNKDCAYYHAAPKAFNRFLADIKKIYDE